MKMLRGCQKRVVYLKETGSKFFEGAYFLIKPELEIKENDCDIVAEATKIANGVCSEWSCERKRSDFIKPLIFSLGVLIGTAITIGCYFLFA